MADHTDRVPLQTIASSSNVRILYPPSVPVNSCKGSPSSHSRLLRQSLNAHKSRTSLASSTGLSQSTGSFTPNTVAVWRDHDVSSPTTANPAWNAGQPWSHHTVPDLNLIFWTNRTIICLPLAFLVFPFSSSSSSHIYPKPNRGYLQRGGRHEREFGFFGAIYVRNGHGWG